MKNVAHGGVHLDDFGVERLFGLLLFGLVLLLNLLHDEVCEVALLAVVRREEELECSLRVRTDAQHDVILFTNLVILNEVLHLSFVGTEVLHVVFVVHFGDREVEVLLVVHGLIHILIFHFHLTRYTIQKQPPVGRAPYSRSCETDRRGCRRRPSFPSHLASSFPCMFSCPRRSGPKRIPPTLTCFPRGSNF